MTTKRMITTGASLAAAATVLMLAAARSGSAEATQNQVARGEYLVKSAGCFDCHTPLKMGKDGPERDMTRWLSGHPSDKAMPPPPAPSGPWISSMADTMTAWSGPWGVTFTANLTPDKETGLGSWTTRNFIETFRTGRRQGRGRPILPPMPIPAYQHFTDEDLAAIFAYLQSLPPVKNRVPQPIPPVALTAKK